MAASHHDFADSESAAFLAEEGGVKREERPPQTRQDTWTGGWHYVPYASLAVNVLLSLFILFASSKATTAGPVTAILPSQAMFGDIPTKKVVFQPDASFDVDPFGPDEIDSPWYALAPPGKGHIAIADPAAWALAGGFPLSGDDLATTTTTTTTTTSPPPAEEYTVALYHQLHCLAALKSKMVRLQAWYANASDNEYLRFALGEDQVADRHMDHCFDYLRQTLLCHGDTTLEGARRVRTATGHETTVRGVDGWGVVHACRDRERIYAFADAHRSRNDTGIE
ncbi:hypothetical protein SPBR_07610 [Sporothrix brasiliensis 5110]|uniref:Oxidase ustYa n=1 Tax=Sporothrix brasiliensis 5110 TaxID=1398154 RepID=A0A0C2IR23_9PEZI|nr:uncharacterized protein SPBR_07610 [Sporothrix brasiliensis 5110]KIH89330.1 hypothetical protein SPBR_07610 [Sporothrix brasiliensis 5110]